MVIFVDGVSMGSSLGPVLSNIVMTELNIKIQWTRLNRHPKGPAKKYRIIRVVGLTVVKCITKVQKGPKIKCRIIRVVGLTVVG